MIAGVAILALATMVQAQGYVRHNLQVVDELGRNVTDVTSIQINTGASAQTIYRDRQLNTEITNPMTTTSTNTTLSSGGCYWYGTDAYNVTVVSTAYGTATFSGYNASVDRVVFPSYWQEASSGTHTDAQSESFGTDSDWVVAAGAVANRLTLTPASDGATLYLGSTSNQADIYLWGASTDYTWWDESAHSLKAVSSEWVLDDASSLWLGTGSDVEVRFDGTDMDILADDLIINIGADGAGSDVNVYSETAGDYIFFDEDNAIAKFRDYSISLDDDADLSFGTGNDFVLDSDTAKTLDILPAAASDDYIVNVGLDQSGVDLKLFGATTGEYWLWDASADSILPVCGNALYTLTDAEANQFKVDATGTVAGYAIVFETTAGGIQLNADGVTQGDIAIDAADDMTMTAGGDLTLAVTGTVSAGGSALTNQKYWIASITGNTALAASDTGKTIIVQNGSSGGDGPNDVIVTLPAAAAGLSVLVIDANETAAADVTITAGTGDTIDTGSAAGSYIHDTDADNYAYVELLAIDATNWAVVRKSGTWSAE
jgi:hypothetical protein